MTAQPAASRLPTIELTGGKAFTPIRDQAGNVQYELRYYGQLVGFATSPEAARERLNEAAYDHERGRLPLDDTPAAVVASVAGEMVQAGALAASVVSVKIDQTSDGSGQWPEYVVGDTVLGIEDRRITLEVCDELLDMAYHSGLVALRALSYILEYPDIRRLIGRDAIPPSASTTTATAAIRQHPPFDNDPDCPFVTFSIPNQDNVIEVDIGDINSMCPGSVSLIAHGVQIDNPNLTTLRNAITLLESPQVKQAQARVAAGLRAIEKQA